MIYLTPWLVSSKVSWCVSRLQNFMLPKPQAKHHLAGGVCVGWIGLGETKEI